MKTIVAALAFATLTLSALSGPAYAFQCNHSGSYTYCDNGVTYNRSGDYIYGSDGTNCRVSGSYTYCN